MIGESKLDIFFKICSYIDTKFAPTAAALPPELPPAICKTVLLVSSFVAIVFVKLHGLATGPNAPQLAVLNRRSRVNVGYVQNFYKSRSIYPIANSSIFVFPTMIQPWSINRCTIVLVYGGRKLANIFEAHVVNVSRKQKLSLIKIGRPYNGESSRRQMKTWIA